MVWMKGQSGNPQGRPKGAIDKRRLAKAISDEDQKILLEKALEMAKNGNEPMLRLLLDKLLPNVPRLLNDLEAEQIAASTYHKDKASDKLELEIELLKHAPEVLGLLKEKVGI